jgi:hypothetical protein
VTDLVGEVEPKLTERTVEVGRNRRLNETRADGCLIRESTYFGQPPRDLGAVGEQQLERLRRDIVPRDTTTSASLLRHLQAAGVRVQRVWDEVSSQPRAGCTTTAPFDSVLRRISQGGATRSGRQRLVLRLVDDGSPAGGSLVQAIRESLGEIVTLGRRHNSDSGIGKRHFRRWINS